MLTDRFKALEKTVAQLPPDVQDRLAEALEDALHVVIQAPPALAPALRAALDSALEQHAASVEYLKDN